VIPRFENDCNRFHAGAGQTIRQGFSATIRDESEIFVFSGRSLVKFLDGLQPVALLALRAVLGIIFVYHGYPKLARLHGNMQGFFVEHGMPGYFLYVAGILETFGGALLLLGLFARVAGLLLTIEMCVAIWKVNSVHGYMAVHEYEFPLVLAGTCFALATVGAGMISLDHMIIERGRGGRPRPPRGGKT
jgi:putative oxidoreductase